MCLTALNANSIFINPQTQSEVRITGMPKSIYPSIHNTFLYLLNPLTFSNSLSFRPMIPSVRQCAEPMTKLRRRKVNVAIFSLEKRVNIMEIIKMKNIDF